MKFFFTVTILLSFFCIPVMAQLTFDSHTLLESYAYHWTNTAAITDFDRDGDPDILTATPLQPNFRLFRNNGSGNFSMDSLYTEFTEYVIHPAYINADSVMDVVAASSGDVYISWYELVDSSNFINHTISDSIYWPMDAFPADLDGDNDTDIIATGYLGNYIIWMENDGMGNFTEHFVADSLDRPSHLNVADIDNDGDMDILAANGLGNISVLDNDGNENFTLYNIDDPHTRAREVHAVDLDGDDDLDILTSYRDYNRIVWYENIGDSVFASHSITETDTGVYSISVIDIDGDGDMDVVSASNTLGHILVHLNDGNENFSSQLVVSGLIDPELVLTADLNDDNHMDIISVAVGNGQLAWHEQIINAPPNTAPVFVSTDHDTAQVNSPYSYSAHAIDPENDTLSYWFEDFPNWLSASDSVISGTVLPDAQDTSFTVIVSDGELNDTLSVALHIMYPENTAPWFVSSETDTAFADSLYSYTARAQDAEGDVINYIFLYYPSWLTPGDSTLSGTVPPGAQDTSFMVLASDGLLTDTLVVSLTVIELNPAAIGDADLNIPSRYNLFQNFPNPFNPVTQIHFDLPEAQHVSLRIFDARGQLLQTLADFRMPAGQHMITFNGTALASGIYFYQLSAGPYDAIRQMVLLK